MPPPCRTFIDEEPVAYDPEAVMQEVVVHTHYLPRNWRGRAHTAEVQAAFNNLFQFKVGGACWNGWMGWGGGGRGIEM